MTYGAGALPDDPLSTRDGLHLGGTSDRDDEVEAMLAVEMADMGPGACESLVRRSCCRCCANSPLSEILSRILLASIVWRIIAVGLLVYTGVLPRSMSWCAFLWCFVSGCVPDATAHQLCPVCR